jgi:nicotinate-nucleotide adenylyltransferase
MKKKAIFGGTFDPIHNAHLYIAHKAIWDLELDSVIFIPSAKPPHKLERKTTDSYIRYEMVKMAIRGEAKFQVSDYELNQKTLSYTYKTLEYFKELEKDTEWYFLTGLDCLMDIEKWKNTEKIFELCHFVVYNRTGYDFKNVVKNKYFDRSIFLDMPILDISSTRIREDVSLGKNVGSLLPESVNNLVRELGLYK